MFVLYPAVFYKEKESIGYTVVFPDFDFGATCGDDVVESYKMASDYIGCWLYEYYVDNKDFPKASDIKNIVIEDDEYSIKEESFVSLVGIDMNEFVKKSENKTVRKNVTLPSYLNEMAKSRNINVSKILKEALEKEFEIE